MTLDERFEELGVPTLAELPGDFEALVRRALDQGRVLCITRCKQPDGVFRATWSILGDGSAIYDHD